MEMFSAGGLQKKQRTQRFAHINSWWWCSWSRWLSPEVRLLLCRPDDKGNIVEDSFFLPHLKGRSFEDVTVHHCERAGEAPSGGQVGHIIRCPGGVLLPRDGLGREVTLLLMNLLWPQKLRDKRRDDNQHFLIFYLFLSSPMMSGEEPVRGTSGGAGVHCLVQHMNHRSTGNRHV